MNMDHSFQQGCDRAIGTGEVLFADLDENPLSPADQNVNLEKIPNLVRKDSRTDGLRRLVQMSKDAYIYNRSTDESYASFAERYRGHSQKYLNYCHSANVLQDTQSLAMILLENARLPTSTFNTVVGLLVGGAREALDGISIVFTLTRTSWKN